jgi:hypothetical protein
MKTSVEINGYVISIEEAEGVISVNAIKDEEVIEEFTIETEEGEGEDVKGFGDYGDEEEDFDNDDLEDELEGQDDDEDDDEEESQEKSEMPGAALESFQSFINKRK